LLWSTLRLGSFHRNLNRFLATAVREVRRYFRGPVAYASGTWEEVDWRPFDFVAVDLYRDARNRETFRATLRRYCQHGKPVVITEFGCCTYRGAGDKGAFGWAIVDWEQHPPALKGTYVRDEDQQAMYLTELLDVFAEENVEGAFAFTFVMPKYPYHPDPRFDLDLASYGVVKSYPDGKGIAYPDMPWEPKLSFHALARHYAAPE
jgi:hypothetical protein